MRHYEIWYILELGYKLWDSIQTDKNLAHKMVGDIFIH